MTGKAASKAITHEQRGDLLGFVLSGAMIGVVFAGLLAIWIEPAKLDIRLIGAGLGAAIAYLVKRFDLV